MAGFIRLPLVASTVAVVMLANAARAAACGSDGYTYAGFGAAQRAFGISATLTPPQPLAVLHGHVAGWVGVGGPHEGPGGSNEWLQIGLSAFPGLSGSQVYYEDARPSGPPTYHQIVGDVADGRSLKVSVLEIHGRPDWWRVWLDGRPVSKPIYLPGSHDRWTPIATAESWDGGTGGACNTFLYHFRHIRIAHASGGGWRPLGSAFPIRSAPTGIRRVGGGAFLAAEGKRALRLLG